MKKIIIVICAVFIHSFMLGKEMPMEDSHNVLKYELDNGMTVLVKPIHAIPKVSLQLWYNVGSKDEKTGEKGIAHLIEHMIFKGTTGKNSLNLAESDISLMTHMLSGSSNAFTAHDYTGYLFNFPSHTWQNALPIMADCMQNAAFKDDHLSSEMKAVIQELKMRKDNYVLTLAENMITSIFADHPYHYPIIGYKQDLWNVHGADLMKFYKKHYMPNNATLVVVGDVNPQEVYELANKYFGHIKGDPNYKKEEFYTNRDLASKSVTLYRSIIQPTVLLAYVIPGSAAKKDHELDIISWLLGQGKSSRLYKKIVDDLQLATSLSTFTWTLFEHSLFFIAFEPNKLDDVNEIITIIQDEIDAMAQEGATEAELSRATKKARMGHYSTLENTQEQAYEIGKYFLATGDENYTNVFLKESYPHLNDDIKELLSQLRPSVMHKGELLPLPEADAPMWAELQKESDALDQRILSTHVRDSKLEKPGKYLDTIKMKPVAPFDFPKSQTCTLSNGIKVLYYNNATLPKIDLVLELKAKGYYDSTELPGIYTFVAEMLTEGTENYTAEELSDELESRGMSLSVTPGTITMSMVSSDLEKGLELLNEILTRATFDEAQIEKVRTQLLAAVKAFWDNPSSFAGQLIRQELYKGHPFSKNSLGTKESIEKITREDLVAFYHSYFSPDGAKLAVVGDLSQYDICKVLEKDLGIWSGSAIETIKFPKLAQVGNIEINYPIDRDQVVLIYAGLSVDRKDKDYDKLNIFDQILAGGALGSMSSRLFKLREQTGLFYTITGSLVSQATEQPGMVIIKTLVSLDRLKEAEKVIKDELCVTANTISEQEFQEAKNAIANSLMLNFESNLSMASAFLFLDRYGFPADYFDKRAAQIQSVTIPEVQAAVRKQLDVNRMATCRVGRVEKSAAK